VCSDSFFDSPPEPAFFISNITEWRKDIPAPVVPIQEFPFTEFQDMHTVDLFEPKDTVSECSMDSAYQSQSGASRHSHKPDAQLQESRKHMNTPFTGSDIYSPSMSSDNYPAFPEQTLDLSEMPHSATSGIWEATDGSLAYANYTTGQDYSQYAPATMPPFTPSTATNVASQFVVSDTQYQSNPFTFTPYPENHTSNDMLFTASSQWNSASYDATEQPSATRTSSLTLKDESRRASAQDNFSAFVATPTSTTSVQLPHHVDYDQSRLLGLRTDTDDINTASVLAQFLDEDEDALSHTDTAETKLEEERTKVARSHPLYQQLPDKDGKYHCPEEGNAGCSHKPTSLKCNYDKYVDSHLKPFRCNKRTCVGVQFSSTACLLRHEREAHGMHGHGARPHLCHFTDCERAVPGHGFPRRYNLFDHMKRVHQYDGPTTEPSPPLQGQAQRKPVSRKRKASTEDLTEKRQKVVRISAEQLRQEQREKLIKEFLSKKQHIIDILSSLTNPSDLGDDIQLTKEVVGLHDIGAQYRESHGG